MNVLDIIFIIPTIWLAYEGFKNGLIIELSTFFALLLGIYASLYFSDITAEFLKNAFDFKTKYLGYMSFALTFLLVVIAVNLFGKLISKLIDMAALGFVNKSGGGVFGILKAAIFLSFIIFFIEKVDKKKVIISEDLKQESLLYPYIQPFAPEVIKIYEDFDFTDVNPESIKDSVTS